MISRVLWTAALSSAWVAGNPGAAIDYEHLPNATLFPGPWEQYIRAPANKSYIIPTRIYKIRGNVSTSSIEGEGGRHQEGDGLMIGAGGTLSLEFAENIAGRYAHVLFFALASRPFYQS